MEKKKIALLGSTGSIGTQALQIIEKHPERYSVEVLTAYHNADLLIRQAQKFLPDSVVIADKALYKKVFDALDGLDVKVYAGEEALSQIVELPLCDTVLLAVVGFAGVRPALSAIRSGKTIALANKESLVVAGEILIEEAIAHRAAILPIDSEHSAIFQCLAGEYHNEIEKLIITGSGGPFRGMNREQLQDVTVAQALQHPTWKMGRKITIDSATLMNKGLEAIEAKWLFDVSPEQIELVIHPQSIIHSLVQFRDGSVKAQLGLSDMKIPIAYALSYPERLESQERRFDFKDFPKLTFEQPDVENFRSIALAFEAMRQGGNAPCILNAANEAAVYAFLEEKIPFLAITEIIEQSLQRMEFIKNITIENIIETDRRTRILCDELIKNCKK